MNTKRNMVVKKASKECAKADLLLAKLFEEASLELGVDTFAIISACRVLEELELVECSEVRRNEKDTVTTKYMFIATEKLKYMLTKQGIVSDFDD